MKDAKVEELVEPAAEPMPETTEESVSSSEGREARLETLSRNHILMAMGVGLIPVPLVDVAALAGIQLNMIKKLSVEYDIPFKQDKVKSVITSLLGGFVSTEVGFTLASLIKFIPIIGQTAGAVIMPVISGASTYAIYKVFVQHFEAGGTFLDLDPVKVKSYFAEQFTKGKKVVTDMKKGKPVNETI